VWQVTILLSLGGIGWGAWYLATHPEWGEPPSRPNAPEMNVRARSMTIRGYQPRHGRLELVWQVTAQDVGQTPGGTEQWFRQITEGILYRDGQPAARFRAGKGQGDPTANTLSIQGGATMRLEADGTTLESEQVHWRGAQRQLILPRPVKVTRGDLHLRVQRARLDLLPGRLTTHGLTGNDRHLRFQAANGTLLLKERRLELAPVALAMKAGEARAKRVVYLTDTGRFTAQEVQMKLTISPAVTAAATGITLALLNAAAAAPVAEKKLRQIHVDGKELSNSDKEMVFLDAIVTHPDPKGDTRVTADRMVIEKDAEGKTQRIIATGKPRVVNERNEVTGDKMTVFPKQRLVVVEGKFRVVVQPKPGEEQEEKEGGSLKDRLKEGVVTGDKLEYDYRNKNISAKGNLKLVSKGRTLTGEQMFYTDKTEMAEFIGKVHARDEKGQPFDTDEGCKLALNKRGISHVPGRFKATLYYEDEEEPAEEESQKTAAAPKTPAAPARSAPEEKKTP
jgi:lipopolysaccharide export system protein LptA